MTNPARKAYIAKWIQDNRERHLLTGKNWRAAHAEERQEYERNRRRDLKMKLLDHYGRECTCCKEDRPEFLALDHESGGGESDRRKHGTGTKFQWWVLKNLPVGLRILCHNCNFCTWAYGQCAHAGPPTKTGGSRYDYMKALRAKTRLEALQRYGGSIPYCVCCKTTQVEFLTLDHINGGGKEHQRKVGRGSSFYRWLKQNNFPDGFQIMCHNCNHAKGSKRVCPHQICDRETEEEENPKEAIRTSPC